MAAARRPRRAPAGSGCRPKTGTSAWPTRPTSRCRSVTSGWCGPDERARTPGHGPVLPRAVLARGDDPPKPPRAVLARGDDPPEPPRAVLARGGDPPKPPRAVLARGDDPPEPPRAGGARGAAPP